LSRSVLQRLRSSLAREGVTLIQGDSRVEMAKMKECSIDAIVTDPPYGLSEGLDVSQLLGHWMDGTEYEGTKAGFMEKDWDSCVPSPGLWREALRVLKPGGYCLAFGGSRTAHLTQLSLQLAGFDIRDTLVWHHVQGLPKSRSLGHALGHESNSTVGTALAPCHEPIVIARKPLGRGVSNEANALRWQGVGGFNIDGARVGTAQTSASGPPGRWPKNALLSHSSECQFVGMEEVSCNAHSPAQRMSGFGKFGGGKVVPDGESHRPGYEWVERWECAPSCPVAELEAQNGDCSSRYFQTFAEDETPVAEQVAAISGQGSAMVHQEPSMLRQARPMESDGSSMCRPAPSITGRRSSMRGRRPSIIGELPLARVLRHEEPGFCITPKPGKGEREAGLTDGRFQARRGHRLSYGKRKDVAVERLNVHTTVKPIAVMRWLIDLACPEGGTVLDPFNGSGSTGCAAVLAGRNYVGIELDMENEGYLDISAARIAHWAEKAKVQRRAADAAIDKVKALPRSKGKSSGETAA
jgi:DNA modification methylase